jgi:UDP-N-acetylglucosamine 2-epimerase (non-hydrolysing)
MHILTVIGARPNFIKLSALHTAFSNHIDIEHTIVHTEQHYDYELNDLFFQELHLPDPDYHLGIGSGTHAEQVAHTMLAIEPVLDTQRPDWVIVVGDVNATIAVAITAKKMGLRLAHVEAGLRSFDWSMPEEINRVVTDRLSDLLFVSEPSGVENLLAEGTEKDRVYFVGNVMIDTLLQSLPLAEKRNILDRFGVRPGEYAVITIHRPSNTDSDERLQAWMETLDGLADQMPVIFPVHLRTQKRLDEMTYKPSNAQFLLIRPLGYLDMIALMRYARVVMTDSGGIQEETTALGVPCLTLRDNTERPITIHSGTNRLVGSNPIQLLDVWESTLRQALDPRIPEKWDGRTAERIIESLYTCSSSPLRQR